MEGIIKELTTKGSYTIIQSDNLIQSINKVNRMFHYIDLNYLQEGIFFHAWVGYRSNEQIQEVLTGHFLELFTRFRCNKMLIENSQMTGSFSDLNEWLTDAFMPQLINLGLEYNAVVFPENIFSQMAVEDWDEKVIGFQNRSFPNVTEALNWLNNSN